MGNYQIIQDTQKLHDFIHWLPELAKDEVYYFSLFSRHKYCENIPNAKDNSLSRFISTKDKIYEKIMRLESPEGSYTRDGINVPAEGLALYVGLNPRSLNLASRNLLIELARRIANNAMNFSPLSATLTEIHRAIVTKYFVDFDFDDINPEELLQKIKDILPTESFYILKTRSGFHLIMELSKIKGLKTNWYKQLAAISNCDEGKGTGTMIPVPGCIQGGFIPYFWGN